MCFEQSCLVIARQELLDTWLKRLGTRDHFDLHFIRTRGRHIHRLSRGKNFLNYYRKSFTGFTDPQF